MAGPYLADRVKETSSTAGTGTLSLDGAVSGFQTFVAGVGDGNTCYYTIQEQSGADWEVGIGTVTDATPDTLSRTTVLASSNAGALVVFSGTLDVWNDAPAEYLSMRFCTVYKSAAQSIADSTHTAITFDTEDSDPWGMHSTVTNTSRITVDIAGYYYVEFCGQYANNATGYRQWQIYVDGSRVRKVVSPSASGTEPTQFQCSAALYLAASSYVEGYAWQNSTGALNFGTSSLENSYLALARKVGR